jgi:transcriptional regulator with XRE-family HTH domain
VAPSQGFGELLRRYRVSAAMTQEELAQLAGLSVRTIGNIERGRTCRPQRKPVEALGAALGLSETELVEFRDLARGRFTGTPQVCGFCHLPPELADFTGRDAELGAVCARSGPDGESRAVCRSMVIAITGPAGSGKTSLAIAAAYRSRDRFPDGQIFLTLRDSSRKPIGAPEVLLLLLRVMRIEGSDRRRSYQENLIYYREAISGRRLCIVLDDVASEAQFSDCVPMTSACRLIVTSRARLTSLSGVKQVALGPLDPASGTRLLRHIIGASRVEAEGDTAEWIVRFCGGLPMALRIIGARLSARPHWKLCDIQARLAGQGILDLLSFGEMSVRSGLADSYSELEADCQQLFRRLAALKPTIFSPCAVADIAGLHRTEAHDILARIADVHLLDVIHGRGDDTLYALSPICAAYAREMVDGRSAS